MLTLEADSWERVSDPVELHESLGLQVEYSFPNALEPLQLSGKLFLSLIAEFDIGVLSYCCRVRAVRRHKKVAFLEVTVLGDRSGRNELVEGGSRRTWTQLVVDAQVVDSDSFAILPTICLGDIVEVDVRWIWDDERPFPLNLVAARIDVASRWDTAKVVALRKGGFHKLYDRRKLDSEARIHEGEGIQNSTTIGMDGRETLRSAEGCSTCEGSGANYRARKMCSWICTRMDLSADRKISVLDVAGGAGYLAHCLCREGLEVTIVDPRPPRAFNRSERKWARRHGTPLPEHVESLFNDEFLHAPENQALLDRVSLVVAMHADGATEPAVRWAREKKKAIVAVPCCVFPKLFPDRRCSDGSVVVSRADFITYLCETYGLFREAIEDFSGANVACWAYSGNFVAKSDECGVCLSSDREIDQQ